MTNPELIKRAKKITELNKNQMPPFRRFFNFIGISEPNKVNGIFLLVAKKGTNKNIESEIKKTDNRLKYGSYDAS